MQLVAALKLQWEGGWERPGNKANEKKNKKKNLTNNWASFNIITVHAPKYYYVKRFNSMRHTEVYTNRHNFT